MFSRSHLGENFGAEAFFVLIGSFISRLELHFLRITLGLRTDGSLCHGAMKILDLDLVVTVHGLGKVHGDRARGAS